jgi:hypothetical protein
MGKKSWIGVDLDRTLAYYDDWKGPDHIGDPIPKMADRVKYWLAKGMNIKILTARVARTQDPVEAKIAKLAIIEWGRKHFNHKFEVTAEKDMDMIELWDDRAVRVEANTGERASESRIEKDYDPPGYLD